MTKLRYWILAALLLSGISSLKAQLGPSNPERTLNRISFGSCNRHNAPQPLWGPIVENNPDLWIWLGDNIYGDTEDMDTLKAKYDAQKSRPEYQALLKTTPVVGIWDDHDYGVNDGGREYSRRVESQQLMLNFLDVPGDAPQRSQMGAYAAYTFGQAGKKVKVILLDARYFRDNITRNNRRYNPNFDGTILGDRQWQWLENELRTSDADVHILGSGIQVLSMEHDFEKWANFPKERQKLLDLIRETKVRNVIFISGDRHIGEISQLELENYPQPVYDVTSSGLTHTWREARDEANRYRISDLIVALNFGLIQIDWENKKIQLQIRGENNKVLADHRFDLLEKNK